LGRNVKLIRNFISFFSWGTGHIGGIGVCFGGPGHICSGAGESFWGVGMKDLFFVDGRNLKIIFSGV